MTEAMPLLNKQTLLRTLLKTIYRRLNPLSTPYRQLQKKQIHKGLLLSCVALENYTQGEHKAQI